MSRLAELIEELCPDGVEYRPLGEIADLQRGAGMPKKLFVDKGIPAIHYGHIFTKYGIQTKCAAAYLAPEDADKLTRVYPGDLVVANTSENLEDVGKGVVWLGDVEGVTGGHATVVRSLAVDSVFLSYYLRTEDFALKKRKYAQGTKVIELSAANLSKIDIPIPPLEVQREIVRILDQFTTLEAELEAELEARRIQYADYQNRLLFPGNCNFLREVGTKVSLGDIASISKNRIAAEYLDETNFVGVDNLISDRRGRVDSQYSPASGSMTAFSKGDILIGNIRPYLRKVWFSDRDGGCSGDVVALTLKPVWKDRVSPRFLYYVVSSVRFFDFYQATARGGSIPRGDKKKLLFFSFIVPCKQEQEHIVMMLDRFEALINDIFSGLPAEIAARRAQYEHYRDRLLSFPEKVVSRSDAS